MKTLQAAKMRVEFVQLPQHDLRRPVPLQAVGRSFDEVGSRVFPFSFRRRLRFLLAVTQTRKSGVSLLLRADVSIPAESRLLRHRSGFLTTNVSIRKLSAHDPQQKLGIMRQTCPPIGFALARRTASFCCPVRLHPDNLNACAPVGSSSLTPGVIQHPSSVTVSPQRWQSPSEPEDRCPSRGLSLRGSGLPRLWLPPERNLTSGWHCDPIVPRVKRAGPIVEKGTARIRGRLTANAKRSNYRASGLHVQSPGAAFSTSQHKNNCPDWAVQRNRPSGGLSRKQPAWRGCDAIGKYLDA